MFKQKWLLLGLVALTLAAPFFLTGCQKKCPKAAQNIPGTSGFREECPFDTTGGSGIKELNFYFVFDNTDAFQAQIQTFQSQHPGVRVNTKKFVNVQEYEDLIINEIAEGGGPDVMMMHNIWMPKHYRKLMPMPTDLPIAMNSEIFRQTFFHAAAEDLIIDGQIYGMPMSIDNLAVYYNRALLRDLLVNTDHPAELWEGIKEQVFTLTKRDNSPERFALAGIAMGRADNIGSAVDVLYTLLLQQGVEWMNPQGTEATFANRSAGLTGIDFPAEEALKLFTSFALPAYKHYSWNDTITGRSPADKEVHPFITGKVAMIIGYPYLYDILVQKIQAEQRKGARHIVIDDIDIAPVPQLVKADETGRRDTLASYFPLAVSRTTQYPREAWEFIQFMTSADSLQTYHKKTHRPTSRKDMVDQQRTEPLFGVFAYQAAFAKTVPIADPDAYYQIFSNAIQQVARNVLTPGEAIQEAQTQVTCVLKKQKGLIDAGQTCF